MKEKFVLKYNDVIKEDNLVRIVFAGYIEGTSDNYLFWVSQDFYEDMMNELEEEKLVDDMIIKMAMEEKGHNNIQIERRLS